MSLTASNQHDEDFARDERRLFREFIVTYAGMPCRLIQNPCGRTFQFCTEGVADRFRSEAEAMRAAVRHGIGQIKILEVEP